MTGTDQFEQDLETLFRWNDEVTSELSEEEAHVLTQRVLSTAHAADLASFKRTMFVVALILGGGFVGMALWTPWMFVVVVLAGGFAGWRLRVDQASPELPSGAPSGG